MRMPFVARENTYTMPADTQHLTGVAETPLADIQPVDFLLAAERLFGVEGGVPWLDVQVAEHDVGDVGREVRTVRGPLRRRGQDRRRRREGGGHVGAVESREGATREDVLDVLKEGSCAEHGPAETQNHTSSRSALSVPATLPLHANDPSLDAREGGARQHRPHAMLQT